MANELEQQFEDVLDDSAESSETANSGTTQNKHTQFSLSMCKILSCSKGALCHSAKLVDYS